MELLDYILITAAAAAAGAVNAIAGGGTLLSFPMLTYVGVPAVIANVTNTVALCPGYLGATWAQRKDLDGQTARLWLALPAAAVGGVTGALLLLNTGERAFRELVPVLILLACGLLAAQDAVRDHLTRRAASRGAAISESLAAIPIAVSAIYGGYFGAGLSVMILAVLGVLLDDTLTRLNALKQSISLTVNLAAALCFVLSGEVLWSAAAAMSVGALAGGALGGRLAGRVPPAALRRVVVGAGILIALAYLVRA